MATATMRFPVQPQVKGYLLAYKQGVEEAQTAFNNGMAQLAEAFLRRNDAEAILKNAQAKWREKMLAIANDLQLKGDRIELDTGRWEYIVTTENVPDNALKPTAVPDVAEKLPWDVAEKPPWDVAGAESDITETSYGKTIDLSLYDEGHPVRMAVEYLYSRRKAEVGDSRAQSETQAIYETRLTAYATAEALLNGDPTPWKDVGREGWPTEAEASERWATLTGQNKTEDTSDANPEANPESTQEPTDGGTAETGDECESN